MSKLLAALDQHEPSAGCSAESRPCLVTVCRSPVRITPDWGTRDKQKITRCSAIQTLDSISGILLLVIIFVRSTCLYTSLLLKI